MQNFVKVIKEKTGLSIVEFCEKELNSRYASFAVRVKKGRLTPAEIFYIAYRTNTSVHELFGAEIHDLLINGEEGDFAEKVKSILRDLSDSEQRSFAKLIGLQASGEIKKKDEPESLVLSERESAILRLFKNTYL